MASTSDPAVAVLGALRTLYTSQREIVQTVLSQYLHDFVDRWAVTVDFTTWQPPSSHWRKELLQPAASQLTVWVDTVHAEFHSQCSTFIEQAGIRQYTSYLQHTIIPQLLVSAGNVAYHKAVAG